jgi:hypothetical protein
VRCLLTAGQRHDVTQAKALIDGLPAEWVLGDTAFDADHFRADCPASAPMRQIQWIDEGRISGSS